MRHTLKRLGWLFGLLFVLSIRVSAQEQEVELIMGYELGMHFDSIPKQNLLKMGRYQKLWRFDRQDENLSYNGMSIAKVRLFIWDNHLHSIEIKTTEKDGDNFKASLLALYGDGKKLDAMGYRYQWYLPRMRILWDQNLVTKEGVATYVDEKTNNSYFKFMYNQQ